MNALDHGGDQADVDDEAQEGEVHLADGREHGEGPGLEPLVVDEGVGGHGDGLHHHDRGPQAQGSGDLLGHGQEGAHTQKEGEGQVLDEDGC